MLHTEGFGEAELNHVAGGSLVHVEPRSGVAGGVHHAQFGHELGRVVATVLGDRAGQGTEGIGESCQIFFKVNITVTPSYYL